MDHDPPVSPYLSPYEQIQNPLFMDSDNLSMCFFSDIQLFSYHQITPMTTGDVHPNLRD